MKRSYKPESFKFKERKVAIMQRLFSAFLAIVLVITSVIGSTIILKPQVAYADTISACGTISSSGSYTLTQDITTGSGSSGCFIVTADNVTIDGNGHTVTDDTTNNGTLVYAAGSVGGHKDGYTGITLQNMKVVGFASYVVRTDGGGYSDTQSGSTGGNGGSITITNVYADTGGVSSVGGTGDSGQAGGAGVGGTGGTGGTGGSIIISNANLPGGVYSTGGTGGAGGLGGTGLNPGDTGYAGGTGGTGGNGGNITMSNMNLGNSGSFTLDGGTGGNGGTGGSGVQGTDGTDNSGAGYQVNGGDGTNGGNGGDGGTGGNGGTGGSLTGSFTSGQSHSVSGGPAGNGGSGGSGASGGTGGAPGCDSEMPPNCGSQGADGFGGSSGSTGTLGSSGSPGSDSSNNSGSDPVPVFSSASIDRNVLTVTYDSVLFIKSIDASKFTIDGDTHDCGGSSASLSGASVIVTLSCAVNVGESLVLNYDNGTSEVQDVAGQAAAQLTSQSVTNSSTVKTLYFTGASNTSWDTTGNWFLDSAGTQPGFIPSTGDTVYVKSTVATGPTSAVSLTYLAVAQAANANLETGNNITVTSNADFGNTGLYSSSLTGNMTVGGTASFYQGSNIGANATLTGNANFYDQSYIAYSTGHLTGNAVYFEDSSGNNGSGTFEVSGTKTRKYTATATVTRNFTSTGPWTVVADGSGVLVDVSGATYDTNIESPTYTTFTTNGGNFIYEHIAPVISSVSPTTDSYINSVTTSSDISFTVDEALSSGTITITRTGGTADGSSPHTCTLAGTALNSGAHTINLSDTTNGCTSDVSDLVSGAVYTFDFDATDISFNNATQVERTGVTFDNTAPSAPGTPNMTAGTDSGVSSTDDITNDTTPDFTISCESGATVTLKESATTLGSDTCSSSPVTITSSALSSGAHTITAIQTDAAGNVSSASSGLSVTIDTTAPSFSSVTPATSATIDNVTSSSDITFTSSEALGTSSVTITRTSGTADGNSPHTCTLNGTALNSGAHTLDLSNTTNGCTSDASNLVSGTTYTFVLAGSDVAGNAATSVTRTSVAFDNTAPTITSVSSDKAAGTYTVGEVIDIDVTFSEAVTSTGNVTVTLETGSTDRTCTFTVTSATTGTCNYTVQAGDTSADLNINSISGTIADDAGNAMSDFTPTTDLATNEAIVVDTTAPVISEVTPITTPSTNTTPDYTFTTDGAGTITYGGSCSSLTTAASSGSNTITLVALTPATYSDCTITVTDGTGNVSNTLTITSFTISSPPTTTTTSSGGASTGGGSVSYSTPMQTVVTFVKDNLIPDFLIPDSTKKPAVVSEPVTTEVKPPLEGDWNLIPDSTINTFLLSDLPSELKDLIVKFPKLGKVFNSLGVANVADLGKLHDIDINLPKITDNNNPPTDVILAQTGEGQIDVSTTVNVSESGAVEQKIHTLGGKPITLRIKPQSKVDSITGYLTFRRQSQTSIMSVPTNSAVASVMLAVGSLLENKVALADSDKEMLVFQFDYTDPDGDGIYTADIKTPPVEGEYEVITLVKYKDKKLGSKELRMVTVIDPEGYVYEKDKLGREIRIPDAKVSIFKNDTLWDAKTYGQDNPQTTNKTGKYAFLVPEGTYFITVEADGYKLYKSDPFEVKEGNPVHQNIELVSNSGWVSSLLDWKAGILFVILAIYATHLVERRRKNG